jgi:hypothetical protein
MFAGQSGRIPAMPLPRSAARPREDRIFVRDGRRHHRRRYSGTEFRIGLLCLGALGAILAWVVWRGGRPEPALFEAPPVGEAGAAVAADRGPLPPQLVGPAWTEGAVSSFGYDDVYEKINGREGYYKQFGFQRLWFVSLSLDPSIVVDIELYDLTTAANALGAALGERPEGTSPQMDDRGLTILHRNALFATRGRFYVRAVGSDESPTITAQLGHLRDRIDAALEGEPLPWAWALFAGELGTDPGSISYIRENAFSFGFARDVYVALLPDDSELFVVSAESRGAADALAERFRDGFVEYGEAIGRSHGVGWSKDRYISTVSGAKSVGTWTIGVRGAPDLPAAEAALQRLEQAVGSLTRSDS